jgi:nucleotide-binding universal stress UspA family protein
MALKNILVHVDDTSQCKQRLDVACVLARQHGAHLSAIYVVPLPIVPAVMSTGYIPETFIAEQEEFERSAPPRPRSFSRTTWRRPASPPNGARARGRLPAS